MDLYGKKSKSIPQKIVIHLLEIFLLFLSFWILFQGGGHWVENSLNIKNAPMHSARRLIIFVFNIIIFLRISFAMILLLKRRIPWEESFSIPIAFALYYVGFSLFVLPVSQAIDSLDYMAIALFVIGCILNSGGEILRHQWKKNPVNKGKIYTKGFFRFSRHINYFGDLLWVSAFAMITKNIWSISIVIFLFCFFAFYNAPKLDKYLKEKYGRDFDRYAEKTKMLIPFIY